MVCLKCFWGNSLTMCHEPVVCALIIPAIIKAIDSINFRLIIFNFCLQFYLFLHSLALVAHSVERGHYIGIFF